MEYRKIKIRIRGHKIGAIQDGIGGVWIAARKLNRYKLWDIAGIVENGFAPIFEGYKIAIEKASKK